MSDNLSSSGNDKAFTGSSNTFTWGYYKESDAKYVIARLQSIITREMTESFRITHEGADNALNLASGLCAAAGAVLDWIPSANPRQKKISLKLTNNSEHALIPQQALLHKYYYAQDNLNLCAPGESSTLKITCNNDYNISEGSISLGFMLMQPDDDWIQFDYKLSVQNKKWIPDSVKFANEGGQYTVSFSSNDKDSEISFFRATSKGSGMSCGIVFFSSNANADDVKLNLSIMPWRSEADDVL